MELPVVFTAAGSMPDSRKYSTVRLDLVVTAGRGPLQPMVTVAQMGSMMSKHDLVVHHHHTILMHDNAVAIFCGDSILCQAAQRKMPCSKVLTCCKATQ